MNLVLSQKVIMDRHGQANDSLEQAIGLFFRRLGANIFPVPNSLADAGFWMTQIPFDALILSGGGDITPHAHENGDKVTFNNSFDRDRVEFALLKIALDKRKPIIGICRGMHQLNYYFGGKITANVHSSTAERKLGVPHLVSYVNSNRPFVGSFTVNHFHNHGITESQVSSEMEILIMDTDTGVVEAINNHKHSILGVQWHPERYSPDQELSDMLIRVSLGI